MGIYSSCIMPNFSGLYILCYILLYYISCKYSADFPIQNETKPFQNVVCNSLSESCSEPTRQPEMQTVGTCLPKGRKERILTLTSPIFSRQSSQSLFSTKKKLLCQKTQVSRQTKSFEKMDKICSQLQGVMKLPPLPCDLHLEELRVYVEKHSAYHRGTLGGRAADLCTSWRGCSACPWGTSCARCPA